MIEMLRSASAHNAKGASFLSLGRMDEARANFESALETLTKIEQTLSAPQSASSVVEVDGCAGNEQFTASAIRELPDTCCVTELQEQGGEGQSASFTDNAFFVYSQALPFSPVVSEISENGLFYYRSVIHFNLGLLCHLEGSCVQRESVYRALGYYDHCLEGILHSCTDPNCNLEHLQLAVAALNNQAHIFFEFSEFNVVNQVLDRMLNLTKLSFGRKLTFEATDIQGIMFNLHQLRNPTCAKVA